jgi:hypothetical protein
MHCRSLRVILHLLTLTLLIVIVGLLGPAHAWNGCDLGPPQTITGYGVQNPGNAADVCDNGECRMFTLFLCDDVCQVEVCFADYSWECKLPTIVHTNNPFPYIFCGHYRDVGVECRATGNGPAAEICFSDCLPCLFTSEEEAIQNDPRNQQLKDIIDDWLAGNFTTVRIMRIFCYC